ncbi:MAG: hypothetical protein ABSA84_07855 [Gammaproteobacteria bacterium]|jgi:hypothetical protein
MFSSIIVFKNKLISSINRFKTKKINWYLFPQQARDSTCHCLVIFNFVLLQKIKAKLQNHTWRSQEDWIGVTFSGTVAWQKAMARLTNPEFGEDKAFSEYQNYILKYGIHLDRIYTESGRAYYKSSLDPLKNLQKVWLSPYHFVCAKNHPEVIEKTLPLYSDGKDNFIFNIKKNCYEKIEAIAEYFNDSNEFSEDLIYLFGFNINKSGKSLKLSPQYKEYLGLPNYSCLTPSLINYPISSAKNFKCGYKYQYLPEQAKQDVYFHVGLFQLLNLAMGIDQENNLINQSHDLYQVYSNLRREMTKHPDNPWGLPEFKAQNSLEYHLAELFKQDPELMQEVIKVNKYPFNTFEHYENLDNLYDSKDKQVRQSLAKHKSLLPGKEQILAYSFSQSLLTIWTAAVSEKALYAVLELPEFLRVVLYFASRNYHKKILKTVYESQLGARSFIAIWQYIKQLLLQKGIEELFSFDGHGVVVSFSKELIAMQNNNMDIVAPRLMEDLGFTVIDSLYSDVVKPWYVK